MINQDVFKIEGIRIGFLSKPITSEGNFQWGEYQVLFSTTSEGKSEPQYYVYTTPLEALYVRKKGGASYGKEQEGLSRIFESDSSWGGAKKSTNAKDVDPGDVRVDFKDLLVPPLLNPSFQTEYIDLTHKKVYSSKEFKRRAMTPDPKTGEYPWYLVKLEGSDEIRYTPFGDPIKLKNVQPAEMPAKVASSWLQREMTDRSVMFVSIHAPA